MKLYLMRHGDAVGPHEDPDRPLSAQGKLDVGKIAQFLKRARVQASEIFHSDKKRAKETAVLVKSLTDLHAKLTQRDCLGPDDPIDMILNELTDRQEDLLIVGHLPFLPRLISKLVVGEEDKHVISMGTGTVVAMYRDQSRHWQIVWVVSPELA